MRSSCDVFIEINLAKAIEAGIKFFISNNGVILSPGNEEGFIPTEFFSSVNFKKQIPCESETEFDYIVVFDFECICEEGKSPYEVQEIIEFPAVILDTKTNSIKSVFQRYIKPSKYPELSEFCTKLTGIEQK